MIGLEKRHYTNSKMLLNYSEKNKTKNHTYFIVENFLDEETLCKIDEILDNQVNSNKVVMCPHQEIGRAHV